MTFTPFKTTESGKYLISVNAIYVDGTRLPLDPDMLVPGAKLSTVVPYTRLRSDIYNALAKSFSEKAKALGISKVSPVAPFKDCFVASPTGKKKGQGQMCQ
ncbi:putative aspartic proteinase GIP2 [Cardamine amara subsp. amara]|uniref:Aspartic proteinase GIP2 n=1 Tax=Cardamine amara subsp. amara TaxID=228776 RepID=A0ABD1A943_CARAN